MSWPQWSSNAQPSVPPVLNPATPVINSAPAVVPPGLQYTPDQWAQLQQQNWHQWAQWQQQYQQWHQQYGAEYQKSINALAQAAQQPATTLPNVAVPPPLPTEAKPPLPIDDPPPNIPSYTTAPPPTQQHGYNTAPLPKTNERPPVHYQKPNQNWQNQNQNYRYGGETQQKRSYDHGGEQEPKRPMMNKPGWQNHPPSLAPQPVRPPPPKENIEELSEAEKKFDKQFAEWEAQFNKWKEQNAEHPDKEQYREYEKKWESWRAQLLERREQMKRKRLGLVVDSPNKSRPSSQQGLNQSYNSPQQTYNQPPPKIGQNVPPKTGLLPTPSASFNKPPPNLNDEPLKFKDSKPVPEPDEAVGDFIKPNTSGGIPGLDLVRDDPKPKKDTDDVVVIDSEDKERRGPDFDAISKGINTILGDQKLLNMLSMVSQTQNPKINDNLTNTTSRIKDNSNPEMNPHPTYQEQSNQSYGEHSNHSEAHDQRELVNNFDDQTRSSFTMAHNEQEMRFDGGFGRNPKFEQNQFQNRFGGFGKGGRFGAPENEFNNFGNRPDSSERFPPKGDRFPPVGGERFGPNQERLGPNPERFGPNQERFGPNQERFGPNQERFGPNQERFGPNQERFGPNQERFGPNQERFGPNQERFGPNQERFGPNQERFGPNQERFGPNQERFGPGQDRFVPNPERFGPERFESNQDRFGPNQERFRTNQNRFGPNQGRYGSNQEKFGPNHNRFGQDRFGPNQDRFGSNQERFPSEDRFGAQRNDFRPEERFPRGNNNWNNERNFGPKGAPPKSGQFGFGDDDQGQFEDFDQGPPCEESFDNYSYDRMPPKYEEEPPVAPLQDEDVEEPWKEENYQESKIEEVAVVPEPTPPAPPEKENIFQPATVIDYEHKPPKIVDPEILLEPIYMFDYRHKALSRIPLPQRPKWLLETVKNIKEFDPPVVRQYEPPNLRRYPPPGDNWRKDRYQESWPPHGRRNYGGRSPFEERRPYERPYEESRTAKNDWNSVDSRKREEKRSFSDSRDDKKHSFQPMDYEEEKISDTEWPEDEDEQFETPSVQFQKPESNKTNSSKKSAVLIEDLISPPGRYSRPPRIVIILRGPPGSGKTFLAKLIKDKEVENGGSTPRILSLDDYFMVEQEKEVTEEGKRVKIKEMVYEFEAEMEESYRTSLIKSFKKTVTDGYFSFIIVDNINDKVKYFGEMWSFAKQNGFQVYICQLDLDVQTCSKRNIHGRSEADIEKCVSGWEATPSHHPVLDATSLLQSASIPEVEMEEVNSPESDVNENDDGSEDQVARSKWDNFDCSVDNLAKLDGVSKPLRTTSRTMEEYLRLDTEWTPSKPTRPGQKRVRWADLEEQKQQEKMRAIGFVVGHTNWDRMMDPTGGSSALTQTKYIERTGRYKVDQK